MFFKRAVSSVFVASLLLAQLAAAQTTTTTPTPSFVIQSTASGGGFVDPSAAVVDIGGGKVFKFIPAAGNIVSDVKLDGASVMSQVTISGTTGYGSYKIENVQAAHTLAVTFATDPTPPSSISTSFTGSGAIEPAVAELKAGKTKTFKFTAAAGNVISDVKVDNTSVMANVKTTNEGAKGTYSLPYSVGNHVVAVTFIADPTPPMTVTATSTGSGVVEPATAEIRSEKYKSFKFTALAGSILSDVTLDVTSVMANVKTTNEGAKGTYKLDYIAAPVTAHALVATFITDPTPASTITVTATGSGTVEPATFELKEGKSKTFKFTAAPGNVVSAVTVNGTSVMPAVDLSKEDTIGTLKLDYATGNKAIAVTFAADPTPDSNVTCTWTGQGIADPASFVLKSGKSKTINIYPVTGNQISAVTLDGANVMSQVDIAANGKGTLKLDYAPGAHTVAVTFTAKQ